MKYVGGLFIMKLGFHCAFFCVYIFSRRYCYGIVNFGAHIRCKRLVNTLLHYTILQACTGKLFLQLPVTILCAHEVSNSGSDLEVFSL